MAVDWSQFKPADSEPARPATDWSQFKPVDDDLPVASAAPPGVPRVGSAGRGAAPLAGSKPASTSMLGTSTPLLSRAEPVAGPPSPGNLRDEGSQGSGIGGVVRERARLLGENLRDAGRSAAAGARGALSAVNEWAAERERDMAAEAGSGSTMAAARHAEGDRVHAAAKRAEAGAQAEQIIGQYEDGSAGYHAMGIARSAPMMAAAAATRSPTIGALAIGAGTTAEQRSQALAEGATPDQATASGVAHGVLEGGMDALTLGIARFGFGPVKELLSKRFGDTVATRMLQQATATAPRRVALATAEGAVTEIPTTVGQMASDDLILDRDYTAGDYARGARDAAIQGGALSSSIYIATAPLRRVASVAERPVADAADRVSTVNGGGNSAQVDPEIQALREQAAKVSTSGTLGRAAGEVLNARADALERAQTDDVAPTAMPVVSLPRPRAPPTNRPASGSAGSHELPPRPGGWRVAHVPWRACRTGRRTGRAPRAAGPGAPGRPAPGESGLSCPARSAGRQAPARRAAPRWPGRPGSQTPWPSRRRTAAGSTRCPPWPRPRPCPCRCGSWSGRPPASRASGS